MAKKKSSQKFIARNRAPRVQIEYDVELYGAEKKINLPFVMGVMADLSGKPAESLPGVADRNRGEFREARRRTAWACVARRRDWQRILAGGRCIGIIKCAVPAGRFDRCWRRKNHGTLDWCR